MAEKKTFRAVRFHPDKTVKVDEVEFPKVTDDDVLIKVEASSINPVDVGMSKGTYPAAPKPPYTLGFEGSGTVVEVGKNHAHRLKAGDRVVFVCSGIYGAWAEYTLVPGTRVFQMHPDNTFEEAASHFVNPVTVTIMFRLFQKEGHKAVIQSAANSALGRMLIKLFKENGIKTINLVRRDDAKEELLKIGADYVVNTNDDDFEQKLEEIAKRESATKFYDAIGGEFAVKVLRKLPPGSVVTIFGVLAPDQRLPLTSYDLFSGKKINGYIVTPHFESLPFEEKEKLIAFVQEKLKTIFQTKIVKTLSLDKFAEGIEHSEKFASEGKAIIKPWQH